MPITQNRMMALIAAANDFKQAYQKVEHQIALAAKRTSEGANAKDEIMLVQGLMIAEAPTRQSGELIVTEAMHFKHTARRNERSRAKISQMRVEARGQGKTYQTSPESPGFGTGTKLLRAKGLKAKGKGRAGLSVDYEATKAKNPGLATVNEAPEDIDFTKF